MRKLVTVKTLSEFNKTLTIRFVTLCELCVKFNCKI